MIFGYAKLQPIKASAFMPQTLYLLKIRWWRQRNAEVRHPKHVGTSITRIAIQQRKHGIKRTPGIGVTRSTAVEKLQELRAVVAHIDGLCLHAKSYQIAIQPLRHQKFILTHRVRKGHLAWLAHHTARHIHTYNHWAARPRWFGV